MAEDDEGRLFFEWQALDEVLDTLKLQHDYSSMTAWFFCFVFMRSSGHYVFFACEGAPILTEGEPPGLVKTLPPATETQTSETVN